MRAFCWILGVAPFTTAVSFHGYHAVVSPPENTSSSTPAHNSAAAYKIPYKDGDQAPRPKNSTAEYTIPFKDIDRVTRPQNSTGACKYTLPFNDRDPVSRRAEIELKQSHLLYGPSLLGNTAPYPGGPLGNAISDRDQELWTRDAQKQTVRAYADAAKVSENINKNGGIKTLKDFKILYQDQWRGSVPRGIARGQSENYTSDLLFAMERLSINPYILRRLRPHVDALPFEVEAGTVKRLTSTSLSALHASGRLFVADHSYQRNFSTLPGRYAAACTALFYLDGRSNQFLPLAIKTNVGADLTYTPLDQEHNNWLLAKIMFNANDLFHSQVFHIAYPHVVAEATHLAALRTMSARHPVLALLERLMYQAYAIRPIGERVLFNKGGTFEQTFANPSEQVYRFAGDVYRTAGRWRANYLEADLRARGLIGADDYGPALPHFPFFEDSARLLRVMRAFVRSFVDATYGASDAALAADEELQAWVAEANGPAAGVRDFEPGPLATRAQLVDILTHMAWLTGCAHHVLNQGEPVTASGVLPTHPAALYAPVPASKNISGDLLAWLPDAHKAVDQVTLLARFNRPDVVAKNQTLKHMFAAPHLLAANGEPYRRANDHYVRRMARISDEIRARTFDARGLSQGMPFVWQALDPGAIPFYLSV